MPKNIRIEVDATDDRPRPPKTQPKPRLPAIYMPFMAHVPLMEMVTRLAAGIPDSPKPSRPATVHDVPLAGALERLCKRRNQEQVAVMLGYDARSIRRWIKSKKFSSAGYAAVTKLLKKPDI
jgi:hypothetical protein